MLSLGQITVTIPRDALPTERTLTVVRTDGAAPAGHVAYSPVFRFEPEGTTFARPIEVSIAFDGDASRAAIFWTREGSTVVYERLVTTVTRGPAAGPDEARAQVTHFSSGFVGTEEPGPPEMDAGLAPGDAGPQPMDAGEPIDATAPVDAGELVESGAPMDAGELEDASEPIDAGASMDMGETIDAGEPIDAGGPADAGEPADAGDPTDTGPIDSGPTDAGPIDSGPIDSGPTDAGPSTPPGRTHACSRRFGDSLRQLVYGVDVDDAGNTVIAGTFSGTLDFGGAPLVSAGGSDVFIVKLDASCSHVWSYRFGAAGDQLADDVAVDGAGNVTVFGTFTNTLNLGGATLTPVGAFGVYVARFAASGAHVWSRSIPCSIRAFATSVALGPFGTLAVAGYFEGTIDFAVDALGAPGGSPITGLGHGEGTITRQDGFVAMLDAAGSHLWSRGLGGDPRISDPDASMGQQSQAHGVAVASDGRAAVVGYAVRDADLGGGPTGPTSAYLAMYSASGAYQWARVVPTPTTTSPGIQLNSVAFDGADRVVAAGQARVPVDLGGGARSAGPGGDVVLASYASDGTYRWDRVFSTTVVEDPSVYQATTDLAVSASGDIVLAASGSGIVDFGTGVLTTSGPRDYDYFLAAFDASGATRWAYRLGDPAPQLLGFVELMHDGTVVYTGGFNGVIDFTALGGAPLVSAGGAGYGEDVFIARFVPP